MPLFIKTALFLSLLFSGTPTGLAQNGSAIDSVVQKLYKEVENTDSDSLKVRLSIRIGYEHFNSGNFKESEIWYEKAINKAIEKGDTALKAVAVYSYAAYYMNKREPENLEKALRFIKNDQDNLSEVEWGILNLVQGQRHILEGKLFEGERFLIKSKKQFTNAGSEELKLKTNFALGNLMLDYGRSEEAVDYFLQDIDQVKEEDSKAAIYYSVAAGFNNLKKYDKALQYLKLAMPIFESNKSEYFLLISKLAKAEVLVNLKHFREAAVLAAELENLTAQHPIGPITIKLLELQAAILRSEKSLTKSSSILKKALALADTLLNDQQLRLEFLYQLSENYYLAKDYQIARSYIDSVRLYATERGRLLILSDTYLLDFKMDSTLGNYKSAVPKLKRYYEIKDSLTRLNDQEKIARLEKEYEAQRKDEEIARLQLDNKEQELRAVEDKSSRSVMLLLLLLALGLILFLFYRYSSKLKTNEILKSKESKLSRALQEKELLLKEIHHRVKNNLQLIMSLLSIQGLTAHGENKIMQAFLEKGESRIQSMALIHQILYETDGMERVSFKSYLTKLIGAIRDAYPSEAEQIKYQLHISDITFDLERALALGLITHEVIINAVKHAFPVMQQGNISIHLFKKDKAINLAIKDDGIGLNKTKKRKGAIGLELVDLLAEQLRAKMRLTSENGTEFSLVLPL